MTLRVTALTYDVVWLTGASQVVPRRDTVVLGDFDCLLDGSTLTATPRGNYPPDSHLTRVFRNRLRGYVDRQWLAGGKPASSHDAGDIRTTHGSAFSIPRGVFPVLPLNLKLFEFSS